MKSQIFEETYTLSNSIAIPKLSLGTWFIDDDKAAKAVCDAAEIGYRHIDTAQAYGNERGAGEGARLCGVPREKLFITSKPAAEAKTYEAASAAEITTRETQRRGGRLRTLTRRESCALSAFPTS